MTCYDWRASNYSSLVNKVEEGDGEIEKLKEENKILKKENINKSVESQTIDRLKSGLCAIITELESKGIANEVIAKASREGLIDLMSFWEIHSKSDESRMAKEIHKYSIHEQNIIKNLLG